jgi:hypothetical protein
MGNSSFDCNFLGASKFWKVKKAGSVRVLIKTGKQEDSKRTHLDSIDRDPILTLRCLDRKVLLHDSSHYAFP